MCGENTAYNLNDYAANASVTQLSSAETQIVPLTPKASYLSRFAMRIPTKPATFSDLKAAICSDVKPDAVPRRSRPKIPIGMSDAGAAPAGRWG